MIAPSELLRERLYADIDPEVIATYLGRNGWRMVFEEDGSKVGIRWYHHPSAPLWPNRELVTNAKLPFMLAHLRENAAPGTIAGGGALVRVGAKRYRDYAKMNRETLLDLEVHENRWIGFIIADIRHLAQSSSHAA